MNRSGLIEQYIRDELAPGRLGERLMPNDSLLAAGVLDSLSLLRLISFVEETFGISVDDGEVVPENFDTLQQINVFIARKLEEQ